MSKGLQNLVESRMKAVNEQRAGLTQVWNPYIAEIKQVVKESQGREIGGFEASQIAQVLENAVFESGVRGGKKIFETTQSDAITFLGVN